MICNNTSKGVLNTLQFVLIETGQISEQRVTIVQTTTNQGICSKDSNFRSEILSNSTEVTHLKEARFASKRYSNLERIFEPQGSTTVCYAVGFGELWPTFD